MSSVASDMDNRVEELNAVHTGSKEVVNVLLVGESGVGKSTFINAFANYLHYSKLEIAMKNELIAVIPTKITTVDENYEERVIEIESIDKDSNESNVSEPQYCKSYLFPIRQGNLKIRFIDTLGTADTKSTNYISNFENILSFISDKKQINAICVLLKPNVSRLSVELEYCIKQLVSRLDKSAYNNFLFVFTNSRSTFYRPGETFPILKKLFEKISRGTIPLSKENIFCMDNEGFRFLAASKSGVKFDSKNLADFSKSWKKSSEEFCRMIRYIAGGGPNNNIPLKSHGIHYIISINQAQHLILQLSKPLADITQLIQDNISLLRQHSDSLSQSSNNLAELKKKLRMPFIDSNITVLDRPVTVCTNHSCIEIYEINKVKKYLYKQRCHNPCNLINVPREIIGSPLLNHCAAMNAGICMECNCSYTKHMHIYYEEKNVIREIEDLDIQKKIDNEEEVTTIASELIEKTKCRLAEYENERNIILKTMAKFAYFLQENDKTTTYNDAYKSYLLFLIEKEKSMDNRMNSETILEFTKTLEHYEHEKEIIVKNFQLLENETNTITANNIINYASVLYTLKHSGDKIKQLVGCDRNILKKVTSNNDYIYNPDRNVTKISTSNKSTNQCIQISESIEDNKSVSDNVDQYQNKNCNQQCTNHKTTDNTCKNSGIQNQCFHIPINCEHTNTCSVLKEGTHENPVSINKSFCFHFHIYDGVSQDCHSEKKPCSKKEA